MSMMCKIDIYLRTIAPKSILSQRGDVDLTSVKVDIYPRTIAPKSILSQKCNVDLTSVKVDIYPETRNSMHTNMLAQGKVYPTQ